MYGFTKMDGTPYRTAFSPREIAKMYCFDAWDNEGNSIVVWTDDIDFKSFEYQQ